MNSGDGDIPAVAHERKQPLYKSLIAAMRQRIESGQLQPGQRAPSESDLIAEFRVSSTTARRCLDELERLRLVRRVQGKGTFVTSASALSAVRQIGLLYNEFFSLTDLTSAHFLRGIGEVLETNDRHPMLIAMGNLRRSGAPAAALQEIIHRNKLEGLIVMSPTPYSWISGPVDDGLPVASANFQYTDPRVAASLTDAPAIIARLHQRLSQHGHDRVTVIRQSFPQDLLEGLHLSEWTLPDGWVMDTYPYFGDDQTQQVVDRQLAMRERPTAFITLGYELALRVRHAIKSRGLAIPDDVSLMFTGASPGPSEIDGELSAMIEIGRWAANAVIQPGQANTGDNRIRRFTSESVHGATLAAPAKR